MGLHSPFLDVRIERPHRWNWIKALPLVAIDFQPPASGPEIELTLGTLEGQDPLTEEVVRELIPRFTGCQVLAFRQRDGVTISVSKEGAESFVSDSSGWGAIGMQEITEKLNAALGNDA